MGEEKRGNRNGEDGTVEHAGRVAFLLRERRRCVDGQLAAFSGGDVRDHGRVSGRGELFGGLFHQHGVEIYYRSGGSGYRAGRQLRAQRQAVGDCHRVVVVD